MDKRSDQVREILGKTPNWMIRSGTSLIFVILVLLLFGSANISYNDIIMTQVVITSKNPPIYLKARTSGRLTNIFVKPNQRVNAGEVLAEIENTASFEDVIYLNKQLESDGNEISSLADLRNSYPPNLDLGDIQLAYGNFLSAYQNSILFNNLAPTDNELILIRKQLQEQRLFLKNQTRQLELFEKDLALSKNNFNRQTELFDKGVISQAEYDEATRAYLSDQQQYEGFLANISNTQIAIANFNNLLSKTNIQGAEYENIYRQELENTKQSLVMALDAWQQQFLIVSPIEGKVTVFDIWNQYQHIDLGETLFTVIPIETEGMIGRVTLPIRNSGKVKVGQKVIIKLTNYPFEEWGSLSGQIQSISEVPKQRGEMTSYIMYITLNNLKTSFGKQIEFRQEMQGTAEIVVEELSILQRIFYQLRKVFNRT